MPFLGPQNPAAFPPVTCPLGCCCPHSPLLWPSNTGLLLCPSFLLSLPLRGELRGECFVSGFSWHLLSCCRRDDSTSSRFLLLSEDTMNMGFLVSSCICAFHVHFHNHWGLQTNILRSKYTIRLLWQYCNYIQEFQTEQWPLKIERIIWKISSKKSAVD